jgi:hypothetical protein
MENQYKLLSIRRHREERALGVMLRRRVIVTECETALRAREAELQSALRAKREYEDNLYRAACEQRRSADQLQLRVAYLKVMESVVQLRAQAAEQTKVSLVRAHGRLARARARHREATLAREKAALVERAQSRAQSLRQEVLRELALDECAELLVARAMSVS